MARSPLEEHAPDVTREIMGRLSPEAMRTLRAVSEMRNRPAEDVLREELRGYIADKLPLPDVEASSTRWASASMRSAMRAAPPSAS